MLKERCSLSENRINPANIHFYMAIYTIMDISSTENIICIINQKEDEP